MARSTKESVQQQASASELNEVRLRGRLSKPALERELPSGDLMATFAVVITRPPDRRTRASGKRTVDTLDCVAWTAGTRRRVRSMAEGDVIEVTGTLHRRFWQAGPARVSRYEVEVMSVTRLSRAAG